LLRPKSGAPLLRIAPVLGQVLIGVYTIGENRLTFARAGRGRPLRHARSQPCRRVPWERETAAFTAEGVRRAAVARTCTLC
jgi:hypothetical protein